MSMKEVWQLLEIEPTKDKREIKRAYAQAVKKYHPEEDPEGFQRVHAAYRQALSYAQRQERDSEGNREHLLIFHNGEMVELVQTEPIEASGENRQEPGEPPGEAKSAEREPKKPAESGAESTEAEPGRQMSVEPEASVESARSREKKQIEGLFQEMQTTRQRRFALFCHKWQWYLSHQSDPNAEWEMRRYFSSDWFLDIAEEPAVIARLVAGIRYCRHNGKAIKEDLWRLYDLDHVKESGQRTDHLSLYHILLEDPLCFYERKFRSIGQEQKKKLERKKNLNQLLLVFCITAALIVLLAFMGNYGGGSTSDSGERVILNYLSKSYPMAEFSIVGELGENTEEGYEGGWNYSVQATIQNADGTTEQIKVTAAVLYLEDKQYLSEDFGTQYVRKAAASYGVECELGNFNTLCEDEKMHTFLLGCYPGGQELDDYMESFLKFMSSDEVSSITNIEGVAFCITYCETPDAFLNQYGGMPEPLVYKPDELPDADTLTEELQERVIEYYIHMEPWRVDDTTDYGEWLAWYQTQAAEVREEPKTETGASIEEYAKELGEQVLVYQRNNVEYITIGDFYRVAKLAGFDYTVEKAGDGYVLKREQDGTTYQYTMPNEQILCYAAMEMLAEGE